MDAWQAKQPETRLVCWPWVGKQQLVTMSAWHWQFFDWICRHDRVSAEQLHRRISQSYPVEIIPEIGRSIGAYVTLRADREAQKRAGFINDNYWHRSVHARDRCLPTPEARASRRHTRPVRHWFPEVRTSPFLPFARVKRLFVEAEMHER